MTNSTSKNFPPESKTAGDNMLLPLDPEDVKQTWAGKAMFFIFCAALVLTTIAYGAVHQPILALFYVSAAALAVLWAIDAMSSGFLRYNRNLMQLPLAAAIILGLIQIIPFGSIGDVAGVSGIPRTISYDPYATRFAAIHLIALLVYFAATMAFVDNGKRLRKLVLLITVFGAVFAFFAIIQVVLSPTKIYGIYEPRFAVPFGSFVNRHNFAAYMELTIALPLGLLAVGGVERDKRLLYITAITLMGIALAMSGSRGGFISLLAEVIFLVLITTKVEGAGKLALRAGATAALVLSIIVGTVLLGGESSLTRFAESTTMKDPSTSRTHIWTTTVKMIGQNPIIGNGLNAFGVAYTAKDTLNGMERAEQAHNDYLQTISDAGLIGAAIGAAFLFFLFRTGFRNIRIGDKFRRGVAAGALAGCFAILVHSMFDFVLHTTAIALLFLTSAALVAVSRKNGLEDMPDAAPATGGREAKTANVMPLRRR